MTENSSFAKNICAHLAPDPTERVLFVAACTSAYLSFNNRKNARNFVSVTLDATPTLQDSFAVLSYVADDFSKQFKDRGKPVLYDVVQAARAALGIVMMEEQWPLYQKTLPRPSSRGALMLGP